MLGILSGIKWWLLGALGAAVVAYVGATQLTLHNRQKALDAALERSATLAGQLDQVQGINRQNVVTLERLRADHSKAMGDVLAELERRRKAGARLTVVRQEIARDPDASLLLADRCPALDRFFDRMQPAGAAAPDRDADRAGSGPAPGGPAVVRGGAAPAAGPAHRPVGTGLGGGDTGRPG